MYKSYSMKYWNVIKNKTTHLVWFIKSCFFFNQRVRYKRWKPIFIFKLRIHVQDKKGYNHCVIKALNKIK